MTYPTFIDFHKLATDTETLAQTRILAQHMITNNRSYAPPSELLSLLSVVDIELLLGMIENSTDSPTDPWTKQIATMVCVFAQAEGVDLDTIDLSRQYGYFCSIIALVSLARKGFTDLNYENISFVDSKQSNNAVIARMTPEQKQRAQAILSALGIPVNPPENSSDDCNNGDNPK